MMSRATPRVKTFLDAGVLIAAARGTEEVARPALRILDDPQRDFIASAFLKLEVLPKAIWTQRKAEAEFYLAYFSAVSFHVEASPNIVEQAQHLAQTFGLAAMDALHAACALAAGADELITTENPQKPLHRVAGIRVTTLK